MPDPPAHPPSTSSGDFTMRLRVNGANMHARGANIIPMEEFEGRQTAAAYRSMLQVTVTHARVRSKSTSAVNGGNSLHQPFVFTTINQDDIFVLRAAVSYFNVSKLKFVSSILTSLV